MESFTAHECLNKIIAIAIKDGTITASDVHQLIECHGGADEDITVDILSMIYQRRSDLKLLKEAQAIYREYYSSSK